jgi:hypothetical protein
MLHAVSPSTVTDVRGQLVIAAHHPDRLRWPSARLGALAKERFQQTLLWNVFRTFELLPPAFWLRRLHVRLFGETLPATPQIVRVSLWQPLTLPPAQRVDGAQPDVVADVVIETELALWTLTCWAHPDEWTVEGDFAIYDLAARVIDAGAWRAGTRHYSFGVIENDTGGTSAASVLMNRYSRSTRSVTLRSGMRGAAALPRAGAVRWTDLADILRDCAQADVLTEIERSLARNAVAWLDNVGMGSDGLMTRRKESS